jgi:hypothetical protein
MYILCLFEAVYISHDLTLEKKGLESGGWYDNPIFSFWAARLQRLAKSTPQNRFLGSLNVYKYGLRGLTKNAIYLHNCFFAD